MPDVDGIGQYFHNSRRNAILAWLLVAVLAAGAVGGAAAGRLEPLVVGVAGIALVLAPVLASRDATAVPPWPFLALLCLPTLWEAFSPIPLRTGIVPSLAVATLALLLVVELDRFTPLRLVPWFAVALTTLATLATAGLLAILRWSADVLLGTTLLLDGRSQDAINAAVMVEFAYATVAGLLAGGLFYWYFLRVASRTDDDGPRSPPDPVDGVDDAAAVPLGKRLGVSVRRQRQLVRGMQLLLVVLLAYGLWSRQIAVVTNAALALAITFIPAVLERDLEVPIEPGLVLWVTAAVFLHALGTAGFYDAISRWDLLTHTLSATVVAAAGYAALRAIHLHTPAINLPRWALFSFLLVFMLAMSVVWELLEFVVDQGALIVGMDPVLAQHGIDDTIVDMLFNLVGALVFSAWGTVYLTEVSDALSGYLEGR